MKNYQSLQTDFYQLSMIFANVVLRKGNQVSGFEGFVREIKENVNPNKDFYIFDGKNEIDAFMNQLSKDIKEVEFRNNIIELITPKLPTQYKDLLINVFKKEWEKIDFNFEYNVVENGTFVFPLIPVFQFKGNIFGQLIETYITNIYNGKTALATIKYQRNNGVIYPFSNEDFTYLENLMINEENTINKYTNELREKAIEFRNSTDKILLEAAFRRAPTKEIADIASSIAIETGWNGTSNTSLVLNNTVDSTKVGGTMSHSFIMGFETEEEAFFAWDLVFPGTTMLIDTYDVENAAKLINRMSIVPSEVKLNIDEELAIIIEQKNGKITLPNDLRIDSDPIDTYARLTSNIMGKDVGCFLSGDMTPDKFNLFKQIDVPYTKAMAGTKYVYFNELVASLNSGFVYKIVEFEKENVRFFPQKKSIEKVNFHGLKNIEYDESKNEINVYCKSKEFNLNDMSKIKNNPIINFIDYN